MCNPSTGAGADTLARTFLSQISDIIIDTDAASGSDYDVTSLFYPSQFYIINITMHCHKWQSDSQVIDNFVIHKYLL